MQTPELNQNGFAGHRLLRALAKPGLRILFLWLAALMVTATACKKDAAYDAIHSDANGYVCLKCGAKMYTDRSVFIGPKCPKCNEDTLIEVVGYYCEKDQHLTIRARRGDPEGPVCEQCRAPLVNAMRSPREKDLKTWGATKVSS